MADDMSAAETATRAQRKRMAVFRRSDAVELDHDAMPFVGMDAGVMAGFAKLAATGGEGQTGAQTLVLFKEAGEEGMSLVYAWFKSGFVLPRHSHDADCLYYVIGGSLQMGSVELGVGDGVFIPADDAYTYQAGPQGVQVLEFRNATRFHLKFKGNDDAHWDRMAQAAATTSPPGRVRTARRPGRA